MKKIILGIFIILVITYFLGPHPDAPILKSETSWKGIPNSVLGVKNFVDSVEALHKNLKDNNQGKVVFADSLVPKKTKFVFLYVHGFSASQMEGDPVHRDLAKAFGANLVLARVAGHGEKKSDQIMQTLTADEMYQSVENYYAIAKKLGDEVVVLGTSFGGAMSLNLCKNHPEIKALILYGPCIQVKDPAAEILDNPWGLQIARMILKGENRTIVSKNPLHEQYWSLHYRIEGIVAMQNFLTHTMNKETFAAIKTPVYLTYYYKDEQHQDDVVSVDAMKEMFPQLGTPDFLKKEEAFPLAGYHVMTSPILGKHVEIVTQKSIDFLEKTVKMKRI
ncbi:MAG: Serine-type D-Ala-D-Ala carboxypeptidase [Bacteroidota bacterium]|jgi:esterase/lipase